jgi:hypothetical protein
MTFDERREFLFKSSESLRASMQETHEAREKDQAEREKIKWITDRPNL